MLGILAALLLIGSFALSVLLTAIVRKLAPRVGLLAHPTADRHHRAIIPLGGGIAIFTTLAIAMIIAVITGRLFAAPNRLDWLVRVTNLNPVDFFARLDELVVILLCTFVLFLLGLWDDKKPLGPFLKLSIQCIVAMVAASIGEVRVELFIENKLATSFLSAIWIVLIINAFNFLDNMDGASAGIAVIASSILFIAAAVSGQMLVGGLALVFIGTLLGFLVFNFPPAKIFMGDAGSLVIGFLVALLTLRTTYYNQAQSGPWYPVLMPLVVMAVPLYDFVSVTILRISQGKNPFIGDTQHFSHRLKNHRLTDTQAVLTLYLATLCTGLGAVFLYQVNTAGAILIFAQTFLILAIIAVFESTAKNEKASE